MAELALERASTPQVRALGERIASAQGPEIETMTAWLNLWGEDHPAEANMTGIGHPGMDMGGLDQETAMAELAGLAGTDFDKRFLELMIQHHRGAIEMARALLGNGENPQATQLAGKIIDDQIIENTEMTNLLNAR